MGASRQGARRAKTTICHLGIDVGSVSLKCVALGSHGEVWFERYVRTAGRPVEASRRVLGELRDELGADCSVLGAVVTGSGKELLAGPLAYLGTENEIIAHATAGWTLHPEARSIIEIGGQDSKYIRIGRSDGGAPFIEDHAFNDLCAAGTGAFLDQQAERLGLDIASFGELAAQAPRAARVAGRCSVFAKTDMIHLQQQACPTAEIASGLCFALARNYLVSLCRGVSPTPPILFQGGVAANAGVVRAFETILKLDTSQLVRPERHLVMGAYGAACIAIERPLSSPLSLGQLTGDVMAIRERPDETTPLSPLSAREAAQGAPALEVAPAPVCSDVLFMGLDVGSVSTKGVIVDGAGRLVASSYRPTGGKPVITIPQVIADLESELPGGAKIGAVVTTGSGRHLAENMVHAHESIDEISAQARAAHEIWPEATAIIEIGGQDSKYIQLVEGKVARFQMNKACAAGTGAFLEEQAGRLDIDIAEQFAASAFTSSTPSRLGSRCTVFMDSALVHQVQRGAATADLCAGLAYSIVRNYLEKVVGSRPLGDRILFQGGVAKNRAIHAAFCQLLEREVRVHPTPEISGALGAALTAIDRVERGRVADAPWSFETVDRDTSLRTFECRSCTNVCEVQEVSSNGARKAFFGSICGRFEKGQDETIPADDAFAQREQLLTACMRGRSGQNGQATRGRIGFPYALTMTDYLPFWHTLFSELGYEVVLSSATDRGMVEWGLTHTPAEFCYPIKVLFGHVKSLLDEGIRRVFIPHPQKVVPPGETEARWACAYTQSAPYVVDANSEAEVLTLELPLPGETAWWVRDTAKTLRTPAAETRTAFERAQAAQKEFVSACRREGERLLKKLERENRRGVVLLGRPYNTSDRFVNLNLTRRLKGLGLEPVPLDFMPLETEPLPPFWCRIRWIYGRKMVQAARLLKRKPNLSAVIITNYGCGPDAFIDQYLEHELSDTPHVLVEFDEHQAGAGLLTRLEAFARTSEGADGARTEKATAPDPGRATRPLRELTYWIPRISDHCHAFIGALRAAGCRAVLLPPTDDESWELGLQHAFGHECHPYVALLGDLLKAARRPDFVPEEACYFGPSYNGPCLLPQYMLAMKLVQDRVGLGAVTTMNLADYNTTSELGNGYMPRLMLGFYVIDRLYKWKVEIQPFEICKGEVAAVHQQNLEAISCGLAEGHFWRALRRSVRRMNAIELSDDRGRRPVVGIVGDYYTRVNEHANNRLYERLEDMGFEVWTSATMVDSSLAGAEELHVELSRRGKPLDALAARALVPLIGLGRFMLDRFFPTSIRTPQERQYPEVARTASRYVSHRVDKVLSLNLNRVEEFHQAGADGVINAMCHNCMLGMVTSAMSKTLRQDTGGMPLCSVVYEGLQSTHNVNRLEAFAHQVRSRHRSSSSSRPDEVQSAQRRGRLRG